MIKKIISNKIIIFIFFFTLLVSFGASVYASTQRASTGASLCGNGVIDIGEECDGANLASQTCISRGFESGPLSCDPSCTINTTQCVSASSGGGGGGGGATPPPVVLETTVVISGRAYPGSNVTILKDGQIVASTVADPAANFRVSVSGLSGGNYIFGIYSEDEQGRRSSLLTFPATISAGVTIEMSNLFIAPTIALDKSEVKHGDNISIFGQSVPNSEVTIAINSEQQIFKQTNSDSDGTYLYNFDTSQIEKGQHSAKSKSTIGGAISTFGQSMSFLVGTKNVELTENNFLKGDLNNDQRVNLVDFSIGAYWYKRQLSDIFKPTEIERLNGDGKIDLVDFSIMAFYWTG